MLTLVASTQSHLRPTFLPTRSRRWQCNLIAISNYQPPISHLTTNFYPTEIRANDSASQVN